MSDFARPRLGGFAPALSCGREVGGTPEDPDVCGRAAAVHIVWDMQAESGLACEEHAAEIRRRFVFAGMHPHETVCSIRGARWLPDEDRCVVDDDDLGLEATADLALAEGAPR